MIWNEDDLVESACSALASAAREFDLENATRGIDCLNEVELQQRISETLISQNGVAAILQLSLIK